MAIVSFDKEKVTEYVPASQRGSEDPCVIGVKFVPFGRVKEYASIISTRTKGISDPLRVKEIALEVQKRQFLENIASVKNFFIGDREVTGVEEFYENADAELIYELIQAMESSAKLSEGQKKN